MTTVKSDGMLNRDRCQVTSNVSTYLPLVGRIPYLSIKKRQLGPADIHR